MPAHLLARPSDIAPSAVISGDPARIEQLSSLLRDAKLVNTNRAFTTYTGYYRDTRLTLAAHGIGGPSTAIVAEELHMLGAKTIVRFGTAGGLIDPLRTGDFVVPTGAAYSDGSVKAYVESGSLPAIPDPGTAADIASACKGAKLTARQGLVFSSDSFYTQDLKVLGPWIARGVIAVEMECATLFTLGLIRGFKAASLLMMSNSLVNKSDSNLATAEKLKPFAERGGRAVFEALAGPKKET